MEFRGNRWYKCDLHLHTPESKCFPDVEVNAEEWVKACLDKSLEVVAVTDHNTGNYIDQIIDAAQDTRLTVFPGVEITCDTSKVHLLILFDKDKRSQDINAFLHYCGIQDHKFAEQDATTDENETIFTIAEKAHSRGAIVIPAHIDEYNGISETSHQTMQTFLNKPYINGVQVVNEELYNHNQYSNSDRIDLLKERYPDITVDLLRKWNNAVKLARESKKAILTFSDNPSGPKKTTHGLWGIGNRYTWIKMEENISLESLRHALLMPSQKIRNDFESKTTPYIKPELLFKGIEIDKTILNTEKTLEIQFNPQLNTIIGGRGTGKSAINRIIRGLLNYNSDLNDFSDLLSEQTDFFKKNETTRTGEEKKGIITGDTEIRLFLERLGRTYKIVFSNYRDGQFTKSIFKLNNEGAYEETTDSILDLFRAEIYSQKQIYHIATRPNALREKIDQSIDSLSEVLYPIDNIQDRYLIESTNIRTINNRIAKKERIEIEKKDIEDRLLEFKEKGYQTILNKQKEAEVEHSFLEYIINDLEQKKINLQKFTKEFTYLDFDSQKFTPDSEDELKVILAKNTTEFQEVITKLLEANTILNTTKESLEQAIKSSNWNQQFEKIKKDFLSLQDDLNADDIRDLENIEALKSQLIVREIQLTGISQDEKELASSLEGLEDDFKQYVELRKRITSLRREFLQEVLTGVPNIKIEVKPFRDSEYYETELRKIFQKPDTYPDDFKNITDFVFNGQVEKKLKELRDNINSVKVSGEDNALFSRRFNTLIKALNDEQMDKIRLLYPEDKIEVLYKANDATGYKSISNASAGQKTSAILTFLLSYGTTPLLLDQPEDDLDNQLIYELIVDRLSNSKDKRQIITVTHNANIPVNGDTEWVIAMNSESKEIEVLCEGSIEDQKVKDSICSIMEGGKEAFKLRAKRYKLEG